MQPEYNQDVGSNVSSETKRFRYLNISEPEYRALKNIAYSRGKTVDDEIEYAIELWQKASRSRDEIKNWSKTQHKFMCFHDVVELSYFSELETNLIEAAIRRHLHDFDIEAEFGNSGCRLETTEVVSLQVDSTTADKIKFLKESSGSSLSRFVNDAVKDFNRRFRQCGVKNVLDESGGSQSAPKPSKKRFDSQITILVHLEKNELTDLCKNLQLGNNLIEYALTIVINWKLKKISPSLH